MIAIALLAGLLMPPAQFDHEPTRPYRVIEVPAVLLNGICPRPPHRVVGCTWGNRVFIERGLDAEDRASVLRHELAHLNGWHHQGE